jgi:hypothetical protein
MAVGPPLHPQFSPPAASRSGGKEREAAAASMRHYCCRPSSEGEGGVVLAMRTDEVMGRRGEEATSPTATRRRHNL